MLVLLCIALYEHWASWTSFSERRTKQKPIKLNKKTMQRIWKETEGTGALSRLQTATIGGKMEMVQLVATSRYRRYSIKSMNAHTCAVYSLICCGVCGKNGVAIKQFGFSFLSRCCWFFGVLEISACVWNFVDFNNNYQLVR